MSPALQGFIEFVGLAFQGLEIDQEPGGRGLSHAPDGPRIQQQGQATLQVR